MAHKTMIGGTAYEVQGGKTLVDGTAYEIQGGKTMVDGTVRDISFGTTHQVTVKIFYAIEDLYGSICYASVDGVNLEASETSTGGTVNEVKSVGPLALKVFVSPVNPDGEGYTGVGVDGKQVLYGSGTYTLNTEAENISVEFRRPGVSGQFGVTAVIKTT